MSTASVETGEVEDLSLCHFVRANNGSARLRNSLEVASYRGKLPFQTVSDYLASASPMDVLCARVKNFGRRSAFELDRMIQNFTHDSAPVSPDAPAGEVAQSDVTAAVEKLLAQWNRIDLRGALSNVPSGRLARVLEGELGTYSVRFALEHPEKVSVLILNFPSAGRGTVADLASELRLAVSKLIRIEGAAIALHDHLMRALFPHCDGPSWSASSNAAEAVDQIEPMVREVLGEVTVAATFDHSCVTVRLDRLIKSPRVGDRQLVDVLLDRTAFDRHLRRVSNIGRTTILQFWEHCWRRFALALARHGVADDDLDSIAAALGISVTLLDAHPQDLAEEGLAPTNSDNTTELVVVPSDLDGLLNYLLAQIKPRDALIIRRRFGLDGGRGETLEEIGIDLAVTRERIRQIEKFALRALALRARPVKLVEVLTDEWMRAWEALADGDDLVTDLEFDTFRRSVPGAIKLSLELSRLELGPWLSSVSQRYPHGWLAPHRSREGVDEALAALDAIGGNLLLPRAVEELGLPGSRLDIEAALLVGRGQRILHGYLVEGRVGARRRRLLALHATLVRARVPLSLVDLQRLYHAAAPTDLCSSRDMTIVMSDAPHLFLEIMEGRWLAIGSGGELPPGGRRADVDVPEDPATEADLTVASAIRDELQRVGPQAMSALTDNPRRYLPPGRSHNSVQPTLITRPDAFARLLPGVYGLWSQIPSRDDVISGSVPYLLNAHQARIFALARRAGEPWGAFPLWSPEAEYRLCRWAESEGPDDVRRSLLAVSTVGVWPLEDDQRVLWRQKVALHGRFDLVSTIRPAAFTARPELDRVLASLIELEASGRTSWMTLNRIDGRPVTSHCGCALLATLVLCGAALSPDSGVECAWQLPHGSDSQAIAGIKAVLLQEMHEVGTLSWLSPAGRLVCELILSGAGRAPGWIPFKRFADLFRNTDQTDAAQGPVTDEQVGEVGRALLAERRMTNLLDWLDQQ